MNKFEERPATKESIAMRMPLCGFGINDAPYFVNYRANGKRVMCPFYNRWQGMINRAYSQAVHKRKPTYKDCTVSKEWSSFMAFKKWMLKQDFEGKHLDKDILIPNNKHYSSKTCVFITPAINLFLASSEASRGKFKIGVCYLNNIDKFEAKICIHGKQKRLGYFNSEQEAFEAWKAARLALFDELIDDPKNNYIKKGLVVHRALLECYN